MHVVEWIQRWFTTMKYTTNMHRLSSSGKLHPGLVGWLSLCHSIWPACSPLSSNIWLWAQYEGSSFMAQFFSLWRKANVVFFVKIEICLKQVCLFHAGTSKNLTPLTYAYLQVSGGSIGCLLKWPIENIRIQHKQLYTHQSLTLTGLPTYWSWAWWPIELWRTPYTFSNRLYSIFYSFSIQKLHLWIQPFIYL